MSRTEQELINEKINLQQKAKKINDRIIEINEELIEKYTQRAEESAKKLEVESLSEFTLDFLKSGNVTYNTLKNMGILRK